jgi:hypothetical protein
VAATDSKPEAQWWAVTDSNLRRDDGVSEAGAVSRNPERREGPKRDLVGGHGLELEA